MSAWDDRTDDDAYEAREEALGERLADAEFNRGQIAVWTENSLSERRFKACVEAWPECESGLYDPRCCRFPKSCSPHGRIEAVLAGNLTDADLEPPPARAQRRPLPRAEPRPVDDPVELLRRHVMDWGTCNHRETCICSDAQAWRWLRAHGEDAGPADQHGGN